MIHNYQNDQIDLQVDPPWVNGLSELVLPSLGLLAKKERVLTNAVLYVPCNKTLCNDEYNKIIWQIESTLK